MCTVNEEEAVNNLGRACGGNKILGDGYLGKNRWWVCWRLYGLVFSPFKISLSVTKIKKFQSSLSKGRKLQEF